MRRKTRKFVSFIIIACIIYLGYNAIFYPDELQKTLSNLSIRIFNRDIFIDENERINYDDIVNNKELTNKDYSNSVFHPYYELLNDNQKSVYNQLFQSINNKETEILLLVEINSKELSKAFSALLYDHPELYMIDSSYSFSYLIDNSIYSVTIKYRYDLNELDNMNAKIDEEVNRIINLTKDVSLDYEKEKIVHDELAKLIDYDETVEDNQTVYAALVNHKCVCSGYVKAFQLIMMRLGIPTYYINGYAEEEHAWNLIELEDGFYNVDLTWDDQEDRTIYTYFNIDEDTFDDSHERREESPKIVKAEGNKYINKLSPLYK